MRGAGSSFSVKHRLERRAIPPPRRDCEMHAPRISVSSISDSYTEAMPKATQSSEKQRSSHGPDSGDLLPSPARNFKNMTRANRHSRQLTEINEARERKR